MKLFVSSLTFLMAAVILSVSASSATEPPAASEEAERAEEAEGTASTSQEEDYVRARVIEMYGENTLNPLSRMTSVLDAPNFSSALDSIKLESAETNRRIARIVSEDERLTAYFEELISKQDQQDETLTVEDLNYDGFPVRKYLKEDLGVELLEEP